MIEALFKLKRALFLFYNCDIVFRRNLCIESLWLKPPNFIAINYHTSAKGKPAAAILFALLCRLFPNVKHLVLAVCKTNIGDKCLHTLLKQWQLTTLAIQFGSNFNPAFESQFAALCDHINSIQGLKQLSLVNITATMSRLEPTLRRLERFAVKLLFTDPEPDQDMLALFRHLGPKCTHLWHGAAFEISRFPEELNPRLMGQLTVSLTHLRLQSQLDAPALDLLCKYAINLQNLEIDFSMSVSNTNVATSR